MKIVQFKDGTYGLRKWRWTGYEFLGQDGLWHGRAFHGCRFQTQDAVLAAENEELRRELRYLETFDKGTPV